MYWVDDSNSKYYNKLVEVISNIELKKQNLLHTQITKENIDWKTAEHLYDYPKQYSYAIEIKYNPRCIKKIGSAVFLHCSICKNTAGCIAIPEKDLKDILIKLQKNVSINIKCKKIE